MKRINKKKLLELSVPEREEYLSAIEEIQDLKRMNPLYFFNHPTLNAKPQHQRQMEFLMLKIRTKLIFGGNQSGKSYGGAGDDVVQAVHKKYVPPHLLPAKKWNPPFKCRCFSADLQHQMLQLQEKIRELLPKEELINGSWRDSYNKQHRILHLNSGSIFEFMSYDQEIKSLGGVTIHRVHYDEEPPKKVWEESQPRLSVLGGDEIFTMTPQEGLSWTYYDMWLESGGEDDNYEKWLWVNEKEKKASIVIDIDDNPYLTEESRKDTIKGYSSEVMKARKSGRFVHFAGMIYSEFKDNEHIEDFYGVDDKPYTPAALAKSKRAAHIIVGIDPGLIKCGVLFCAVDEENNIHVFDEIYKSDWTIEQICDEIKRLNAWHEVSPMMYVIDPHARDRSKQTGRSDQSEFTKNGIYTILGQNAVQAGINDVKTRLRDNTLSVSSNCRYLIREFHTYRWKEMSHRIEQDQQPEPIKKDDHLLDALRYVCMSRPYAPVLKDDEKLTWQEKLMKEDIESKGKKEPLSEFGGGIYL